VGIYSIGQKVANVIFTYMTAIQNVFSPQVYRRMFDLGAEGSAAVGRYLTPFAYVSIAFGLMIALFSEEIIFILTPPPFHDAIDIVIVLSMFYGSQFFGKQPQLIYAKKTYITSLLTVVSILLTIIVAVPFTMKWGAMGTAWGILLSGLVSMAIFFMVSQHYYRIEWEYPKIIAIFLIFFVSAFSIIFLRYIMVEYTLRLLLKGLFIASYAYLGIKIRIITAENFDLLKNMIRVKGSAVIGRN
jgi:O-antigen/teichoic acid export membrane protein